MKQQNPNYILRPYDQALSQIYHDGFNVGNDRTGVGTVCKFGISTEFDVSERAPIPVKRAVKWQSIVKEVLWYISGSHSILKLEQSGCKIWTPWKNDAFTTKHNLPQGSGGYIYGFNLIHFGAKIEDVDAYEFAMNVLYPLPDTGICSDFVAHGREQTEQAFAGRLGFNQLDYVIDTLRTNPASRQACFVFWRPDTNHMAVLPACHAMYSFIVSPDEQGNLTVLNCDLFQRSADYLIGVPFGNIPTAYIFTALIAQQLNMTVGKIYHNGAHCHIYNNALEQAKEYIGRNEEPDSPIMHINKRESIYDYIADDFTLEDYNPLPAIKMPIAV